MPVQASDIDKQMVYFDFIGFFLCVCFGNIGASLLLLSKYKTKLRPRLIH